MCSMLRLVTSTSVYYRAQPITQGLKRRKFQALSSIGQKRNFHVSFNTKAKKESPYNPTCKEEKLSVNQLDQTKKVNDSISAIEKIKLETIALLKSVSEKRETENKNINKILKNLNGVRDEQIRVKENISQRLGSVNIKIDEIKKILQGIQYEQLKVKAEISNKLVAQNEKIDRTIKSSSSLYYEDLSCLINHLYSHFDELKKEILRKYGEEDEKLNKILASIEELKKMAKESKDSWGTTLLLMLIQILIIGLIIYVWENTMDPIVQDKTKGIKEYIFLKNEIDVVPELGKEEGFVIRDRLVNEINKHVDKSGISNINIFGDMGSGKSVLAKEYAKEYIKRLDILQEKVPYYYLKTVGIFSCENLYTLEAQYRQFAKDLGIEIQGRETKDIKKEIDKKLIQRNDWLIIFLNVDDNFEEIASSYFPQEQNKGTGVVLFTSKKLIYKQGLKSKSINIDGDNQRFREDEAILFAERFADKLGISLPKSACLNLIDQAERRPIAIKLMLSLLKNVSNKTLTDYANETKNEHGYNKAKLLFNIIRNTIKHSDYLDYLSFFDVEPISYSTAKELFEDLCKESGSFDEAVKELSKWGLVDLERGMMTLSYGFIIRDILSDKKMNKQKIENLINYMAYKGFSRANFNSALRYKHLKLEPICHRLIDQIDFSSAHKKVPLAAVRLALGSMYEYYGFGERPVSLLAETKSLMDEEIAKRFPSWDNELTLTEEKKHIIKSIIEEKDGFMTVYAELLYTIGKGYFPNSENKDPVAKLRKDDVSWRNIMYAIDIRSEIDHFIAQKPPAEKELYDPVCYNHSGMDTAIFKRVGKVNHLMYRYGDLKKDQKGEKINLFNEIYEELNNLIDEEKDRVSVDIKNLRLCHYKLSHLYKLEKDHLNQVRHLYYTTLLMGNEDIDNISRKVEASASKEKKLKDILGLMQHSLVLLEGQDYREVLRYYEDWNELFNNYDVKACINFGEKIEHMRVLNRKDAF